MAKKKKENLPTVPGKKKGRSRCCSCLLTMLIVFTVLFVALIAVGLGIGDKFLKENYDVGVVDCFKIVSGATSSKESKIVTDPATDEDSAMLYDNMRGVLFLNDNVSMEDVISELMGQMAGGLEGGEGGGDVNFAEEGGGEEGSDMTLDFIADLYKEENVDYAKMRALIEGSVDIDDVYDQQYVLSIRGNSLVGPVNQIINTAITATGDPTVSSLAGGIALRQLTFSKRGEAPVVTLVIQLNLRDMMKGMVDQMKAELVAQGVPEAAISFVVNMIPKKMFISADVVFSTPSEVSVRLNAMDDATMKTAFAFISKLAGEDIEASISGALTQTIDEMIATTPAVVEMLANQDNGAIKLDVYGLIADMLNDSQSESEGENLTGKDLVCFISGVIGSEAETAIANRMADDSRYADTDWQKTNADALVSAMADSFSLAKTYFVNGTDENGDKIVSVENGKVEGIENMFGRVYVDASGSLYYKREGGAFKKFINTETNAVSAYPVSGYEAFYSEKLHYTANDKDYTLYRNADNTAIYGVSEDGSVMNKNGTYTELTTLYVDAEGNVFGAQNSDNTLIECKKEKLDVDSIMSIVNSENLEIGDILQYVDLSALKINGVGAWNKPIVITDIQLAALAEEMLAGMLEGELASLDPKIKYAALTEEDGHDLITVGISISTAELLASVGEIGSLIGETIYVEVKCDVTLDIPEGEYKPTKVLYNDLSQDYTDKVLGIIAKLMPEANLSGTLESVGTSVRDVIKQLNENMPLEIENGQVKLAAPLSIIKPMLLGEDSTVTDEQFVTSINDLLHSDGEVAVAYAHSTNSDYDADDWRQANVNSFVVNTTGNFGLKADSFKEDGSENYSVSKVMDIIGEEEFGIGSVLDDLDYDKLKSEGFACWKNSVTITDAQLAAVISDMKDDLAADLKDAGIEIEYAHVSVEGGKSFITVGVTANTASLIGGNGLDDFMSVIGDTLYAQLKVDVTVGATEYAESELILNDMTKAQTDGLITLIEAIDESIDLSTTFESVETTLRDVINSINGTLEITFADGKLMLGTPEDLIYDVLFEGKDSYSAAQMTEALTLLAVNGDYAGSLTVPTEDYSDFWNGVLREKYFVSSLDINGLFNSLTAGVDLYSTVKGDFVALKANRGFVDSNNLYRHRTLEDASFKANAAQFTWLFRSNVDTVISDLVGGNEMFSDLEFVTVAPVKNGSDHGVNMVLRLPTGAVLSESGVNGDNQALVKNLLGEYVSIELTWYGSSEDAIFEFNGMSADETLKFNRFVYELTGMNLFDSTVDGYEDSAVNKAYKEVRKYFDDYFTVGSDGSNAYVTMDNLYELMADKAFPEKAGKAKLTAEDVLKVMQNLYELPENNAGSFDVSKLGAYSYVSNATHVSDLSAYVNGSGTHSYVVVGALENINVPAKTADVYLTVKYSLNFGGDASDILPDHVYITMHSAAAPVISAGGLDLKLTTTVVYNHEASSDELAMNKALDYYGIDIDAAVEQQEAQVKNYLLTRHFS